MTGQVSYVWSVSTLVEPFGLQWVTMKSPPRLVRSGRPRKRMRVLLIGDGDAFEEAVRRMVGRDALLVPFAAGEVDCDLIVVESSAASQRVLGRIQKLASTVPMLVLPAEARTLQIQQLPANLAHLGYRDVIRRFGRQAVPDYLKALLAEHSGNVTKAAIAAGLERGSLHRLIHDARLDARSFRSKKN